MTGYVRQSSYIDNDTITDAHSNDEYNALLAAFVVATGHKHDGTAAEGALVPKISNTAGTKKVETNASGALTTGDHQVTGQIISDAGPITATLGDIVATAGDLVATAGDVVVTAGNVIVTTGTVDGRDVAADGLITDTIKFTKEFTSTDQTITTSGSLTIAHGLGVIPKNIQCQLICQTTADGYTAGDIVPLPPLMGGTVTGHAIVIDSTNINVRYGEQATVYFILDFSDGSLAGVVNSRWKLRIKAWA